MEHSWTTVNSLNTARRYIAGCGTQTAALGFSGYIGSGNYTGATESWNGTSWTTLPAIMNTVRSSICGGGIGTQTAALGFGGEPVFGAATTATESYNGTSWTTVNSM
jgi:hypothetical protein